MAISRISAASAQSSSANITTPTSGDLIVVFAHRDGSTTAPSLASGYTNFYTATGGNSNSHRVGFKFSNGTETNTGTWTNATSVACIVFRGATLGGSAGASGGANSSTIAYNTFTLNRQDSTSWVMGASGHRTATNNTSAPTGMTNHTNAVDCCANSTDGTTNSWSTQTVSVNQTSGWRSHTFEIRSQEQGTTVSARTNTWSSTMYYTGPLNYVHTGGISSIRTWVSTVTTNAPEYVQGNNNEGGTSQSSVAASLTGVAAGNLILVWLAWENTDGAPTVSDGTTSLTAGTKKNYSTEYGQFFILPSANAGNKTYTASFSPSVNYPSIIVTEWSGGGPWEIDQQNTNGGQFNAGANDPDSGQITTTALKEIVVGGERNYNAYSQSGTPTIGGTSATVPSCSGQGSTKPHLWYRILSSTMSNGSAFGELSGAGTSDWVCNIISVKRASAVDYTYTGSVASTQTWASGKSFERYFTGSIAATETWRAVPLPDVQSVTVVGETDNTYTTANIVGVTGASSQPGEVIITVVAKNGLGTLEYLYYYYDGTWHQIGDWTTSATCVWDTTGQSAGNRTFSVNVRGQGAPDDNVYPPLYPDIDLVIPTSTPVPTSPQYQGETVNWTGTKTGTTLGVQYRWYFRNPVTLDWIIKKDYGTVDDNTFAWDTTGETAGSWQYQLWVRENGSTNLYDCWGVAAYYQILLDYVHAGAVTSSATWASQSYYEPGLVDYTHTGAVASEATWQSERAVDIYKSTLISSVGTWVHGRTIEIARTSALEQSDTWQSIRTVEVLRTGAVSQIDTWQSGMYGGLKDYTHTGAVLAVATWQSPYPAEITKFGTISQINTWLSEEYREFPLVTGAVASTQTWMSDRTKWFTHEYTTPLAIDHFVSVNYEWGNYVDFRMPIVPSVSGKYIRLGIKGCHPSFSPVQIDSVTIAKRSGATSSFDGPYTRITFDNGNSSVSISSAYEFSLYWSDWIPFDFNAGTQYLVHMKSPTGRYKYTTTNGPPEGYYYRYSDSTDYSIETNFPEQGQYGAKNAAWLEHIEVIPVIASVGTPLHQRTVERVAEGSVWADWEWQSYFEYNLLNFIHEGTVLGQYTWNSGIGIAMTVLGSVIRENTWMSEKMLDITRAGAISSVDTWSHARSIERVHEGTTYSTETWSHILVRQMVYIGTFNRQDVWVSQKGFHKIIHGTISAEEFWQCISYKTDWVLPDDVFVVPARESLGYAAVRESNASAPLRESNALAGSRDSNATYSS